MLFEQLPIGVVAALLVVSCAVKYVALKRLIFAGWFRQWLMGAYGWVGILFLSLVSATITFWLFDRFARCPMGLYITLADALLSACTGGFLKHSRLLEKDPASTAKTVIAIRTIHAGTYLAFIWFTLR